jgi:hypothetical protein
VNAAGSFQPLWSQAIANPLRGLVLAREKNRFLAWDDKDWLYLFDHAGKLEAQMHFSSRLAAACCAEDGSAFAAVSAQGDAWWLAPDLMTTWKQAMPTRAVATALDSFGQYLAVADAGGNLRIWDWHARDVKKAESPRPLHHLAFVPAAPFLVGCSDFGLVACCDLDGKWIWRDGLVAHIGSLTVSGDGEVIQAACYTEGLQRYTLGGQKGSRLPTPEPCCLASMSFDGSVTLVAGLSNWLQLLNEEGLAVASTTLDEVPVAIALSALGDVATAAFPSGTLIAYQISAGMTDIV